MAQRRLPPGPAPAGPAPRVGLGPIQLIPPGLMGLLQLKQTGELPGDLARVVAGVIELRDWYLTARRVDNVQLYGGVAQTLAIATGAIGATAITTAVPQTQLWWVEQYTVVVTPTGAEVATDLIRFAAALLGSSASRETLGPDVSDYQLAARSRSLAARADRGFWAFPGDQFAIHVYDVVTTNGYTATAFLRATPCPI